MKILYGNGFFHIAPRTDLLAGVMAYAAAYGGKGVGLFEER
jgi:hypothetical protein